MLCPFMFLFLQASWHYYAKADSSNGTLVENANQTRSEFQLPDCSIVPRYSEWPHENDCRKFYRCTSIGLREKECMLGRHFNRELQDCDDPEYAKCQSDREIPLLSNHLRWEFRFYSKRSCMTPDGFTSSCRDVSDCRSALASMAFGGLPKTCQRVQDSLHKVCCDLKLVLGAALYSKVEEEKARRRECGRKTWSPHLSPTENKFLELLQTMPKGNYSEPDKIDPPSGPGYLPSPFAGRISRQKDFPWMVAVFVGDRFWCGGSLIDRRHVLSTARCFVAESGETAGTSYFKVKIGNIDLDGGVSFSIVKITIHPKFVNKQYHHNIAILTLEKEILTPHIAHICLPGDPVATMDLTGKDATLLEWRPSEIAKNITAVMLRIVDDMPVISTAECQDAYKQLLNNTKFLPKGITSDFICAGQSKSGEDACLKDGSGQLMYKNNYLNLPEDHPDIPWVLVGLVSLTNSCRDPKYPGIYTRVSSFMKWIQRTTSQ